MESGLTTVQMAALFRLRREGISYRHISAVLGISARRASLIHRRVIMPGVSPEYAAAVRNGQIDLVDFFTMPQHAGIAARDSSGEGRNDRGHA